MSKKTLRSLALEVVDEEHDIDFLREVEAKAAKKLKTLDPPRIVVGLECYESEPCQHHVSSFDDATKLMFWDGKRIAKWYKDHEDDVPDHFKEYA